MSFHFLLMLKKLISLVLPGVDETMAMSFFCPESMLMSDDLPTFDLPTKANSGSDAGGHSSSTEALVSNSAEWICRGRE